MQRCFAEREQIWRGICSLYLALFNSEGQAREYGVPSATVNSGDVKIIQLHSKINKYKVLANFKFQLTPL
jgi:hypothetical protein